MSFLTKKIISFEPEIFGVDLSDLSVKIIQLEKEGDIDKIRSFAVAEIPTGNIEDGKIINKDKVAAIIKETIRNAEPRKIKTNKVICSLPESKAFLRVIAIPNMEEEEVGEAIKWEMEANIPLPIEQVYFDWQFLGQDDGKKKQDILTVAVSKNIIDDLMEVLGKAGLEVYGLEVESVASARSLISRNNGGEKGVALIVDLGAQRTSFIMVEKGLPNFTSSIPFSAESINDAIAKGFNLSELEAEKIKIAQGIGANNDNPIFGMVKSLLENLVQEIQKTIDFYAEMNPENSEVKKIILCGGGSNLKGLAVYLAKRLNRDIEMGDPWVNLKLGNNLPIIDKENAARYSTVIGLALRGLDYGY